MNALLMLLALQSPARAQESPAKHLTPPPAAASTEADNEVVDHRTCKNGNEERVLEILPTQKGCLLQYTKAGATEEKAKSVRGVQICQDAMKKIADRLTAAGYRCE
jgi:hypothetical protein